MPDIPTQLRNEKFRFIRVSPNGKTPIDKGWQILEQSFTWDNQTLQTHIRSGGNYGVLTGDALTVIDCDEPELAECVKTKLPETFTVKTGSGGTHFYYDCILLKRIVLTKGDKHMGEVQAKGQQVIGPTSWHPNGNRYEILNAGPIALLDPAELKAALSEYINLDEEQYSNGLGYEKDPILDEIKSRLKVKDLLGHYGIDTKRNPTRCPLGHDSKGGKCFSFTDDLWNCFHCDKSGNVFHLIMEKEGVKFADAWKTAAQLASIDVNGLARLANVCDMGGNIISDEVAATKISQKLMSELAMAGTISEKKKAILRAESETYHYLLSKYKFVTLFRPKPEYWVYRDGIYVENGEGLVKAFSELVFGDMCKNNSVAEIMGHVQRSTIKDAKEFTEAEKRFICLKNGVYDLEMGSLLPHSPDRVFFSKIPVDYLSNSDYLNIWKFLNEVLDERDVQVAQELIGYLLWRGYDFQKIIFLSGSGANGKTVFANVLKAFLGQENVKSVSMQDLSVNRFMRIQLRNSLLNINPDISDKSLGDISLVKALTGGDLITAESKGKDAITFVNYAKLIFGANTMPRVVEDTDAWYRRIIILNFGNQYLPPVDYENHKGEKNVFPADPHLEAKLTTKGELEGLLLFALEGLKRLLRQGDFSNPKTMESRKREFNLKSDSFRVFAEEHIEGADFDQFLLKRDVRFYYNQWCAQNGIKKPCSDAAIKAKLAALYGAEAGRPRGDNIQYVRTWQGIVWKNGCISPELSKSVEQVEQNTLVGHGFLDTQKDGGESEPGAPGAPHSHGSIANNGDNQHNVVCSEESMEHLEQVEQSDYEPVTLEEINI